MARSVNTHSDENNLKWPSKHVKNNKNIKMPGIIQTRWHNTWAQIFFLLCAVLFFCVYCYFQKWYCCWFNKSQIHISDRREKNKSKLSITWKSDSKHQLSLWSSRNEHIFNMLPSPYFAKPPPTKLLSSWSHHLKRIINTMKSADNRVDGRVRRRKTRERYCCEFINVI